MNAPSTTVVAKELLTETAFAPADEAGVIAVSEVALVTDTLVAAAPPMVTDVLPDTKLLPVIVMAVPPVSGPRAGVSDAMVGMAE